MTNEEKRQAWERLHHARNILSIDMFRRVDTGYAMLDEIELFLDRAQTARDTLTLFLRDDFDRLCEPEEKDDEKECDVMEGFDWDAYFMDKLDCQREEEMDNE